VPSYKDPARRMAEDRSFGTTKEEVLTVAEWLRCLQVPTVDAGGHYWHGPMARSPVCGSYRTV
jgi:hypothetical protein